MTLIIIHLDLISCSPMYGSTSKVKLGIFIIYKIIIVTNNNILEKRLCDKKGEECRCKDGGPAGGDQEAHRKAEG